MNHAGYIVVKAIALQNELISMLLEDLEISQSISVDVNGMPDVVENVNQILSQQIESESENENFKWSQVVLSVVFDMGLNFLVKLLSF